VVCCACRGEKLAGRQARILMLQPGSLSTGWWDRRRLSATVQFQKGHETSKRSTSGLKPASICIDYEALVESATCCRVNLAASPGCSSKRARDVQTEYFRVEPGLICIELLCAGGVRYCCGVNLAASHGRGVMVSLSCRVFRCRGEWCGAGWCP